MSTMSDPEPVTVEQLRDQWGEKWRIWRSDGGGWYATRRRAVSQMEYREGLYRTLGADDGDGLRRQLEQQRERESCTFCDG